LRGSWPRAADGGRVTSSDRHLVIAGGGLAAQRCVEQLRAAGDDRPVTVLAAEPVRPYDRPPLSKELLAGTAADVAFRPAEWYPEHGVELRLGAAAAALDARRRTVVLEGGERVRYDDLLIATGASARVLPPLAPYANVQTLRTLADAERLRDVLAAGGPLAVIGAGLIGLEAAATAAAHGVHVTVVEAAPRPLQGVLGPRAAAWLVALHRANGVVVRTGTTLERVHGRDRVEELELSDGSAVPCAHVLVAIGVAPSTGWLAGSGLDPACVAVDEAGRTRLPGVYAAGDAASTPDHHTGRHRPGGHWESASRGAAAVAATLLGRQARPAGPHSFWSDQHGVRLRCVGDVRGAAEHVVQGDLTATEFELDHVRDGETAGVLLAGRPPSALRAARARLHVPATPERSAA
jgi:NADPH-dependent 2,4-dienoyl-CoA reductase/sulfur reductase-like enzyme